MPEMPNATRMELLRLKSKQKTAQKGHKLLKEKATKLIKEFFAIIQNLKSLRQEVENLQKQVFAEYETSKSRLSIQEMNLLFSMPTKVFEVDFKTENFLGIDVPVLSFTENVLDEKLPYSPLSSTSQMDKTVADFYALFPKILALAELEKKAFLLCSEIEKTKRRVSALEKFLIPDLQTKIDEIEDKLSENERSTTSRLMKVKSMLTDKDQT